MTTLDWYRKAIAAVRRLRPEVVHCNDWNTMWIGVAARLSGSSVVYDSHELWADRNGRREMRWWILACEWLFVRVADRTITTSPGYADVLAHRTVEQPREGTHCLAGREEPDALVLQCLDVLGTQPRRHAHLG